MSPLGQKVSSLGLPHIPAPLHFRRRPPLSHHPSVVVICVKRGPVNRPCSPHSSLVPQHPLMAALSIYGSTEPATLAWGVLVKHEAGNTSLIVVDILTTLVCIDVLEWSCRLNLALVSRTKEGAFEEKLRADLPILVFIVPEV